jgi:hypothetical protein
MNPNKLMAKVTEAVSLDREIADMTERLKELKAELVKAADSDLMDKTDTEGGGWSVELAGTDGCIARVTQPAAKLKSAVDGESANWVKIKGIVGRLAEALFKPSMRYTPVEDFRKTAQAELSAPEARQVLKLMTSNSSPTVSFETKEAA